MNFCSNCGAAVELRIPPGDTLPRYVCRQCTTVHYQNPKLVVGALAQWEDRILLCRRAIEPRHGFWTLPAGFMENDETTAQAAARETAEEARARIEVGELYTMIDVPYISQVHLVYRARLLDLDFSAGEESLEVALLREDEIPWDQIAFRTIGMTLRYFFEDRRRGNWPFHCTSLALPPPAP
ncbi:ADP-ribose pyrophosphatase [Thauera terpenica 58Eu]|jgi:ADP-ribose pyrophosphatase YjhB (NUDIX family)|uniref:ADP-ribose pyrophosphatase n=1 Tax=Thauera terpenica 58Eu TaxID=1348657 RepID=S9ZM42_9RHOO|nr:NUDIX hydrolase [Thauera terpenica]EPZ15666.1 ADP-ribose pyrophosphatase [Thauera terpenica 58Eu]MBP6761980.1 NUDIX hydrolase [Thauera sp.]